MTEVAQQVVQNSSAVATNPATGSTGASGGTAGSNTIEAAAGVNPTSVAVVAPKGFRQELQQMLLGWQSAVPSASTVTSSGGSLTQAGVLEQLQGYLGAYMDLNSHMTAAKQARAQAKSQLAEARKYYAVLRSAVMNLFSAESPQLAQFGLAPKKARKPLSSSQLAVRAAKAKATRALRNTKGAKQKAPLKSGPMEFVDPVKSTGLGSAPAGTTAASPAPAATPVASPAPAVPTVSAVSSPTVEK